MDRSVLSITELTDAVLDQMKASGYKESTRKNYSKFFNKLCRMAEERGERQYTTDLGSAFTKDDSHIIPENTKRYCHERTSTYIRCISFNSFRISGNYVWQAGPVHTGFANWRACPDGYSVLCKQCTDPDLRQFLHQARWEHIPNPEITLRVSCAFFQKR